MCLLGDGVSQGMENFLIEKAAQAAGEPVTRASTSQSELVSQAEARLNKSKASAQVAELPRTRRAQTQSLAELQQIAAMLERT